MKSFTFTFGTCENHYEIRADVAQPVEQRFRNFLCTITANSPELLGIGATTGGRHRIRHIERLCRPFDSSEN
jgi:hypothetical protein